MAQIFPAEKAVVPGILLVAVGDFGRRTLFPFSEIDLNFLFSTEDAVEQYRQAIQHFSQHLGDVGLQARINTKAVSELHPIRTRRTLSRYFRRWIAGFAAGDQEMFISLRGRLISEVMAPEAQVLVERLAETTRNRHRKFANTVFHLEPNVKDGPGGYQDYVMARWLSLMSAMEKQHGWPNADACFSPAVQATMDAALDFFASVRSFLHFRDARDNNVLTWDAQSDAAKQKIGVRGVEISRATDWMRIYFGHTRAVDHISGQLLEEMPAAQSLFYRQMETWRTGFSDADFSVVDGLMIFQNPDNLSDPDLFFRTFRLIAQHGFKLSPTAEHQLEQPGPAQL